MVAARSRRVRWTGGFAVQLPVRPAAGRCQSERHDQLAGHGRSGCLANDKTTGTSAINPFADINETGRSTLRFTRIAITNATQVVEHHQSDATSGGLAGGSASRPWRWACRRVGRRAVRHGRRNQFESLNRQFAECARRSPHRSARAAVGTRDREAWIFECGDLDRGRNHGRHSFAATMRRSRNSI